MSRSSARRKAGGHTAPIATMKDHLSPADRSRNMAQIKGRDTKPERLVRSLLHRLGYRFRLHHKKLPGKPDIVLARHKKIVLIHGCFWHMHYCRRGRSTPKTNADFWRLKRLRNTERDAANLQFYKTAGWETLIVWECETHKTSMLEQKLIRFMSR